MVNNYFIACNLCGTNINLRSQIGYFDINFNLHCPECLTHIYGKLVINQENIGLKLELENSYIIDNWVDVKATNCYAAELSAEFPTRKMYLRNMEEVDISPFIRNIGFYGDGQKAHIATQSAMQFASFIKTDWGKIKSYFELLWNEQRSLLYPKIKDEISKYEWIPLSKVTNDLDATIALHQLFLTTSGLTSIIHPNTLSQYTEIPRLILSSKDNYEEITKFVNDLSSEFNIIEKKGFKLIDAFSKIYEQLIPVVALRVEDCIDNVDREQYGIMTTNFEELTDYYAKSYEWILDNINIVIALNNIIIRNDYTICANKKAYNEILLIRSKYKKLDYIDISEPFSKPTNSLKNHIRNAIQHFNSEIDYVSQKIVFTDNHRGKTNQEHLYLMDFGLLCLDNFSIIIYLLELIYNLRKFCFTLQGLKLGVISLNVQNSKGKRTSTKTGRNSPCPCGSGKKYKRCCGA